MHVHQEIVPDIEKVTDHLQWQAEGVICFIFYWYLINILYSL